MQTIEQPAFLRGAKGGGSPPKPSSEEKALQAAQTKTADLQYDLALKQAEANEALMPYYLESMGYQLDPYSGEGEAFKVGDQQYSLSKVEDPLSEQNKQIALESGERSLKALRGELDVDPAVTQDLQRQRETLEEELLRRLGPGWATSDAGQRAIQEFDRNATTINYGVRHGEMTGAQAMSMTAEDAYRRKVAQDQAGTQNYSQFNTSAAGMAGGAGQNYGQLTSTMTSDRNTGYGIASQNAAAQGAGYGQLAGAGILSATAVGIAV